MVDINIQVESAGDVWDVFNDLHTYIENVETENEELKNDIENLKDENNELENRISELESQLQDCEEQHSGLNWIKEKTINNHCNTE